jgi:hypothetical protein
MCFVLLVVTGLLILGCFEPLQQLSGLSKINDKTTEALRIQEVTDGGTSDPGTATSSAKISFECWIKGISLRFAVVLNMHFIYNILSMCCDVHDVGPSQIRRMNETFKKSTIHYIVNYKLTVNLIGRITLMKLFLN